MSTAHQRLLEDIATGRVWRMAADPNRWLNLTTRVPVSNSGRKWACWHQYALVRPSGEVSLTTAGLDALSEVVALQR